MIYPKEGALPRNNCACIVQESWVTDEHIEAAQRWIDFILEDAQQRTFMAEGLRSGTDLPPDETSAINVEYGLDPKIPEKLISPSPMDPAVAAVIDASWEDVKKPGIVTLVMDTSASMKGSKLKFATEGVIRFLDNTATNNQVGLVTFNDSVTASIPVGLITKNRIPIGETVQQAQAQGGSALYDAIKKAIEMTDSTPGEEGAIRGVVVLTDGKAIIGKTRLHDIVVAVRTGTECVVTEVGDYEVGYRLVDCNGTAIAKEDVTGISLALGTSLPVQIFFIGIGEAVDIDVGRILAEATDAEFEGVAEKDLAKAIERYGKYF